MGCGNKTDSSSSSEITSSSLSSESSSSSSKEPTTLEISEDPEDVTINSGEGFSMHVEVNNPKLVASYQWYHSLLENGEYEYVDALSGSKAKSDTYSLPSIYYEGSAIDAFMCEITSTSGEVIKSAWGHLTINPSKIDVDRVMLGDYTILPGSTFDLANTPYGSGTISVNKEMNHVVFSDVFMSNQFYDSNFSCIGFLFRRFNPSDTNIIFEFKGKNSFYNTYWEEDYYQGGSLIEVDALKLDKGKVVTATFIGDGSLTFYGGSYAIISNYMDIIQDVDMNFYGQPGRYNKGIFCPGYTLKANRSLISTLGGRVIDATGDVTLEEKSIFIANSNGSPSGTMGSNSCINTVGDVSITRSLVRMNILLNEEKNVTDNYSDISWGIEAGYSLTITESDVEIIISEYNVTAPISYEDCATSASAGGLSADDTKIIDSTLNIKIFGQYIAQARAIITDDFYAKNSNINISVSARTSGGIICYSSDGIATKFEVEDTNIDIDLYNYFFDEEDDYVGALNNDCGLVAGNFIFKSSNENSIKITTNGDATICKMVSYSDKKVLPHEDYSGKEIDWKNVTISSSKPYVHNERTFTNVFNKKILYESLYEVPVSESYRFLDNIVLTYIAED